jgi:N-acetylneuraminic acid mutarotase
MKRAVRFLLMLLPIIYILNSCQISFDGAVGKSNAALYPGSWKYFGDFPDQRSGVSQFTIGNKTYVGLGYGGKNTNQYLTDFWVLDLTTNKWDTVQHFPGTPRESSVSFSIGEKGYVGTGFNRYIIYDSLQELNDFWEYDAQVNKWTQIANFPGSARYDAIAFSTATNGYVGSGYDGNYYDDFYEYFPETNNWEQIVTPPNPKRRGAMTMTINGKVYYFGGTSNGLANTDFYAFDPAINTWTNTTQSSADSNFVDFTAAVKRSFGSTLVMPVNGLEYGYVIGGDGLTSVYQYDTSHDRWTEMAPFPKSGPGPPFSFVIGSRGFVGLSAGSSQPIEIWEWIPPQQ